MNNKLFESTFLCAPQNMLPCAYRVTHQQTQPTDWPTDSFYQTQDLSLEVGTILIPILPARCGGSDRWKHVLQAA